MDSNDGDMQLFFWMILREEQSFSGDRSQSDLLYPLILKYTKIKTSAGYKRYMNMDIFDSMATWCSHSMDNSKTFL